MIQTMKNKNLIPIGWIAILVALGLTGCTGGGGRTVSGEVKLDGKPLPEATISFEGDATAKQGGFSGKTNDQGKFVIPITSSNVSAGKFRVLISKFVDKKGKALDPEEMEQLKAAGKLKNLVPAKYNDPAESVLFVDIKEGNNVLQPFELKSK